jgi:hypothetical protein
MLCQLLLRCLITVVIVTITVVTVEESMSVPFASTALPAQGQGMDVGAAAGFRPLLTVQGVHTVSMQHAACFCCNENRAVGALRQQNMSRPQLRMLHGYYRLTKQIELHLQHRHDTTCATTKKREASTMLLAQVLHSKQEAFAAGHVSTILASISYTEPCQESMPCPASLCCCQPPRGAAPWRYLLSPAAHVAARWL